MEVYPVLPEIARKSVPPGAHGFGRAGGSTGLRTANHRMSQSKIYIHSLSEGLTVRVSAETIRSAGRDSSEVIFSHGADAIDIF